MVNVCAILPVMQLYCDQEKATGIIIVFYTY